MPDEQQPPITRKDLQAIENRIVETEHRIVETENRIIEAMRDMQTEMLRGMERFARGNFARVHRLETSDADTAERLNALEERVLSLETKRNGPSV